MAATGRALRGRRSSCSSSLQRSTPPATATAHLTRRSTSPQSSGTCTPSYYPRDAPLIDSQARLTVVDEAIAAMARVTPGLAACPLRCALRRLARAARMRGDRARPNRTSASQLAASTLFAALTLRHAIAKTGTNTLEGYFHPRQLAFALGAWAVVSFLRGRDVRATLFIVAAGLVHPTTALWFAVWLAVASVVVRPPAGRAGRRHSRRGAAHCRLGADRAGHSPAGCAAMDAGVAGDARARRTTCSRSTWPWTVWLINLSYPALIVWFYRAAASGWTGRRHARRPSWSAACSLWSLFFGLPCRSTPRTSSSPFSSSRRECSGCSTSSPRSTLCGRWWRQGDASARRARLVALPSAR